MAAGISQLSGKSSFSASDVQNPVHTIAVRGVDGLADRAGGVVGSVHGGEGVGKGGCELLEGLVVLGEGVAGESVCC